MSSHDACRDGLWSFGCTECAGLVVVVMLTFDVGCFCKYSISRSSTSMDVVFHLGETRSQREPNTHLGGHTKTEVKEKHPWFSNCGCFDVSKPA